MEPIPYGGQHITDEDIQAVVETLRSDYLTQGPRIAEFEEAFASYVGSKYAVAISNGTDALHLCAIALNVVEGCKVITTPITFAASANCIRPGYGLHTKYYDKILGMKASRDLKKGDSLQSDMVINFIEKLKN